MIWTVLPSQNSDFSSIANEEGARAALNGLSPGSYDVPHYIDQKALKDPAMQQDFKDGPFLPQFGMPHGAQDSNRW